MSTFFYQQIFFEIASCTYVSALYHQHYQKIIAAKKDARQNTNIYQQKKIINNSTWLDDTLQLSFSHEYILWVVVIPINCY